MATLPLYLDAGDVSHPDASRRVLIPGGYECWRFDAHDPGRDLHLIALFCLGFFPSRTYLHQAARYSHRPTRHAPPVPRQEPSVYVAAYRGTTRLTERLVRYPAIAAQDSSPGLTLGGSGFSVAADGSLELRVGEDVGLRVALHLRPCLGHTFGDYVLGGEESSGLRLAGSVGGGLYAVEGTLHWSGQVMPLAGSASHDHAWGGPGIPRMRQWIYGTGMGADRAWFWHRVRADSAAGPVGICLKCDRDGVREWRDGGGAPAGGELLDTAPLASDYAQRWVCTFGQAGERVRMIVDQWGKGGAGLEAVGALFAGQG